VLIFLRVKLKGDVWRKQHGIVPGSALWVCVLTVAGKCQRPYEHAPHNDLWGSEQAIQTDHIVCRKILFVLGDPGHIVHLHVLLEVWRAIDVR
jgi:hypothetical protein